MVIHVEVSTIYRCSLERAFKTPMLCDITNVHRGFGVIPRVTHTTDDEDWGQPNSSKKIYMGRSIFQRAGFTSIDHIIERKENQYWILQVDNFQSWMLGFHKFVGRWKTTYLEDEKTRIDYSYHLHYRHLLLYPLCWLFAKCILETLYEESHRKH